MTKFLRCVSSAGLLLTLAGCSSGSDLKRASAQMNAGVRAARINLWREAMFRFQRASAIEPANAMALNNLAVAYEGTGDFEKARVAYVEALRLDRTNQFIQKNYSRFIEFNSRNRKREKGTGAGTTKPAAGGAAPAAPLRPDPPPASPPAVPGKPGSLPPVAGPTPPGAAR